MIEPVSVAMVEDQIDAVFDDMNVAAVKVGMVYDSDSAAAVSQRLKARRPDFIVCDPVMISTSGSVLMKKDMETILS